MLMLPPSTEPLTTCFHLVRHGRHDEFGRSLSGRAGTSPLTASGCADAERVASWVGLGSLGAIHASPQQRTVETASIIAARQRLEVVTIHELDEIDFGMWNGMTFAELESDPLWEDWNSRRSSCRCPNGETMGEAVERAVSHIENFARTSAGATLLCVTHCDIIRGVLAHYLGLSLDNLLRFDIAPGSISTLVVGAEGGCVTRMNEVPA